MDKKDKHIWHQVDLLDAVATEELMKNVRPDYLIHLAWITTPGEYVTSFQNYEWLCASCNLLVSFARYGGKRAVLAGTCFEYCLDHGKLIEDKTPLSFDKPYPATKNILQSLLSSIAISTGFTYAWGRVFFIYGPGEHENRLIPSVINSIINKQDLLCTPGTQKIDFIYVDDVAEAFCLLLDSKITGVFNIGSGSAIQVKEVISRITQIMGTERYIKLGAIPHRQYDTPLIEADIKKIRSKTIWNPNINIDTGIKKSIEWWSKKNIKG